MCCHSDPKQKRKFIASLKERKTFTAWKQLKYYAVAGKKGLLISLVGDHVWKPGTNKPTRQTKRYNTDNPSGFHVYLEQPEQAEAWWGLIVVPLICHVDDLWRIENSHYYEAVIRDKIILRQKDYDAALKLGKKLAKIGNWPYRNLAGSR